MGRKPGKGKPVTPATGHLLRQRMLAAGKTVASLAAAVDRHPSSISRILDASTKSTPILGELCEKLGVSMADFLEDEGKVDALMEMFAELRVLDPRAADEVLDHARDLLGHARVEADRVRSEGQAAPPNGTRPDPKITPSPRR